MDSTSGFGVKEAKHVYGTGNTSKMYLRLQYGFRVKHIQNSFSETLCIALTTIEGGLCSLKRSVEHRCGSAFRWSEVDVAAAHSQPIRLSNGGANNDFHREIQLGHHALNHNALHSILLTYHRTEISSQTTNHKKERHTKEGFGRLHNVEQLGDNSSHSTEMPWSRGTLCRGIRIIHRDEETVRWVFAVHFGSVWGEYKVCTSSS